jgi:16S rRNA (uracil1498-N3)-methyltransferase
MNLFYAPDIDSSNEIQLNESESRHCTMVLRLGVGDQVTITDGKGTVYSGKIRSIQKRKVNVSVENIEIQNKHLPYQLHMAIAPTKQMDRMEWFVEKATEIGIHAITPLITFHSERKNIRTDRIEKIAISAMKQSLKTWKPEIHEPVRFEKFILDQKNTSNLYIAHCHYHLENNLFQVIQRTENYIILIGPEGDFSENEVKVAIEQGYKEVSLGNSRLRTETAGIIACHSVALKNQ